MSRPFVLVHGAFHGGWCWYKLQPLLEARGHAVHAPTLTGLGERAALLTPSVGLETHIADVVTVLESADLQDVVLVGHSYGGLVVTGAADRAAARIARLVLVDSATPAAAKSFLDLVPGFRTWVEQEGWRLPSPPPEGFGVTDPADVAFMAARLTPHPAATLKEPLPLTGAYAALPRWNLLSSESDPHERRRSRVAGWQVKVLSGPHDLMIARPKALAQELLALAREPLSG